MSRLARIVRGALAVGAAAITSWDLWGRLVQVEGETVPYTVLERARGVEFREYPDMVVATTTAESEETAFDRLFAYVNGANDADKDVPMTAPVATTLGAEVVVATSDASTHEDGGVSMMFFLPSRYTLATAPEPTDDRVQLAVREHRRVAAAQFSWFATERKVERARRQLEYVLGDRDVEATGVAELHRYDDPRTPPWQRRNELVVPIADD